MKGDIHAKTNMRGLKPAHYQKEWPKNIVGLCQWKDILSAFFFNKCKWLNILTHMVDTTLQ